MQKLCANLKWLFTELPFLDRFEAAARAGFLAVEYASPYEFSPAALRNALAANGLQQVLINTPIGDPTRGEGAGLACLPGAREAFRDGLLRALNYAAALDCGLVHVQAGIVPAGITRAEAQAVYMENLHWAADLAQQGDVRLTVEPVNRRDIPGFFLNIQEAGRDIVEAIGIERVGLQFDVYHCEVEQGDPVGRLRRLLPVIAHVQLADAPGRHEPGTGDIPWNGVIETLKTGDYQGWVGCEYTPATTTAAGLGWRERWADE